MKIIEHKGFLTTDWDSGRLARGDDSRLSRIAHMVLFAAGIFVTSVVFGLIAWAFFSGVTEG